MAIDGGELSKAAAMGTPRLNQGGAVFERMMELLPDRIARVHFVLIFMSRGTKTTHYLEHTQGIRAGRLERTL